MHCLGSLAGLLRCSSEAILFARHISFTSHSPLFFEKLLSWVSHRVAAPTCLDAPGRLNRGCKIPNKTHNAKDKTTRESHRTHTHTHDETTGSVLSDGLVSVEYKHLTRKLSTADL